MAYDLISIGDCVIDTFIPLKDVQILEKDGIKLLCFPFGHKVPVGQSESVVGGNAANNAVGSARLNLKTAIYTNVGNKDQDESDDRIKDQFKKEGIDISYVVENEDLPTNHNVILEFERERTILIHHQPWKFKLPDFDKTKWIYLTSLSPSYAESNFVDQLINYIERNHPKLAYQPGTFQLKQGIKKNARLLSLAEVIVMNLEEAKIFLGYEVNKDIELRELLKQLMDAGPKNVIITDGKQGSYGYDGHKYFHLEMFPSEAIQVTGAGDAFATAATAALIYGKDLPEAMKWGSANASSVVEQIGPQRGLLTYEGLQKRLKEHSKRDVRVI